MSHVPHLLGAGELMSWISTQHRVITKEVKSGSCCYYVRCTTFIVRVWGMSLLQTGSSLYQARLGLPKKGRALKELVVWWVFRQKSRDIIPLSYTCLLNLMKLNCHEQQSRLYDVLFLYIYYYLDVTKFHVLNKVILAAG